MRTAAMTMIPLARRALAATLLAGLAGLAGWQAASWAQDAPRTEPPPPAAEQSMDLDAVARRLRNYFTEEELHTLFDYLRDASIAALQGKGEEVLMPPDLAFKMAILQERMMREGQYQMQLMMKQLERDIDRALKDLFTFPPPDGRKQAEPRPVQPPASAAPAIKPPEQPAPPAKPVNPYAPQPAVPPPATSDTPQRIGNPYLQ